MTAPWDGNEKRKGERRINGAMPCWPLLRSGVDRRAAKPDDTKQEGSQDWKEDFQHENGNYYHVCDKCGKQFSGHKRRVFCKLCQSVAQPPSSATEVGAKRVRELLDEANTSSSRRDLRILLEIRCILPSVLDEIEALQARVAEDNRRSVPNPCSFCQQPITYRDGHFVGTGDGSMTDGGSFAHWGCYQANRANEAEAEIKRLRTIDDEKVERAMTAFTHSLYGLSLIRRTMRAALTAALAGSGGA